jgi:hypothetical protein
MPDSIWNMKPELIDTQIKLAALGVIGVVGISLAWIALAQAAWERMVAGAGIVAGCLVFLVFVISQQSRPKPAPSTAVGAHEVQVATTEVEVGVSELGLTVGLATGPNDPFLLDAPPPGWCVTRPPFREFVSQALQTTDKDVIDAYAGQSSDLEMLVIESPSAVIVRPRPGQTTSFGRLLYTGLELPLKQALIVMPIPRAKAPLFIPENLASSFVRQIFPLCLAATLVRMESGTTKTTGKQQWFAEFEQQVDDVMVDGRVASRITVRNSCWCVEGDFQDYFLRVTHLELEGVDDAGMSDVATTLGKLASSFRPRSRLNAQQMTKALLEASQRADGLFDKFMESHCSSILSNELILAITRFGGKDLKRLDILNEALGQFEVFSDWRSRGDLDLKDEDGEEDPDFAALFDSLPLARAGDPAPLRSTLSRLVERFYASPAVSQQVSATGTVESASEAVLG